MGFAQATPTVFSLDFFHDSYQNFARNIDFSPKKFDQKMLQSSCLLAFSFGSFVKLRSGSNRFAKISHFCASNR
ncbi:MAG TPA: hypothetical protein DDW51_05865 [Cyanobacteria bacterium UBA11367]|nr:hypothetical protein [Cyanobacteria bacterium UBA11367]